MSDFLTRLVMHAGRAIDVLRPRPLSRFEETVRPSHELTEEDTSLPGPGRLQTTSVPSEVRPERSRAVSHVPETRDFVSPSEQQTRVMRAPADSFVAQAPHPTVQVQPATAMRASETQATTQTETIRHEATHTITRVVEHVLRPETRSPSNVNDAIAPRAAARLNASEGPPPLAAAPPRAPLVRPAVVEPPTRGADQVQSPQMPEMKPDLTVEITIGRVDVRAVMAPLPKSRDSRASKPELSLEDYLRRRGRRA